MSSTAPAQPRTPESPERGLELDISSIREDFGQTDDRIYFNAGLVGFPPRSVWEKTTDFYRSLHFLGETAYFERAAEIDTRWHEAAPAFLNCSAAEVTGVPNTTMGMNLIARAIPWNPGDNVVICDFEFISEYIIFQHLRRVEGIEVRVAKREGWGVPVANVEELIDERTRLVALSHVAFFNGFRQDISAVAKSAHDAGAWIAVDAIQSVGPLDVDVRALDVDFLVAGSSKWMMSLPGWGMLYARKSVIPELTQPVAGFLSLESPETAIADWTEGLDFVKPYELTNDRIDKFRVSTENLLGKLSLAHAMQNFNAIGKQAIESHILGLSGALMDALAERGHELRSVRDRQHRAGIVNFLLREQKPGLLEAMDAQGIHFCKRGGGYRISLHVYNTMAEIDRFLAALDAFTGRR